MKPKTKLVVLMTSFCLVLATCLLSVFAVKNFNLNMAGEIEFVAPGIEATISQATLTGISKKEGSGQMQEFTLTRSMTQSQIADLAGVKSWSGIKLLFDEDAEGQATLSFTITNNSEKAIENIMVNLSTNTTNESTIQATPSADFCIAPKASHTFDIGLNVADLANSTSLTGFKLTVEMNIIKPSEVLSTTEQQAVNGLNFAINSTSQTASFTKYTTPTAGASALAETSLSVEIPAVVKDANNNLYTVTEIKDGSSSSNAFSSIKSTLTSITFPSTLTKIGGCAFYQCTALTGDLVIPNSVTIIGESAFSGCSGFSGSLVLGRRVTTIGVYAFATCASLTGNLIIPNSVTTIGERAFYNCTGLNGKLSIGKNVVTIGNYAFYGCKNLTGTLIIPDGTTTIGNRAFYECKGLTGDLIIPKTIITIGDDAFYNCTGFTGSLIIPDNVTTLGEAAFYGCTGFTGTLTISNSLTTINDLVFTYCKFTGNLTIPNSVTIIGEHAFSYCSGFSGDLIIPNNVTTIGYLAFNYCIGFKGNLILGSGVKIIDDCAFEDCSGFTGSLTIPNSVTTIGGSAFRDCSGFTGDLIIPNNVTTIGGWAFRDCSGFTGDLIIGDSVTTIGNSFWGCSGFSGDLIISDSVTSMGAEVFRECKNFKSITVGSNNNNYYSKNNCLISKQDKVLIFGCKNSIIPQDENISKIGNYAFYSCTGLTGSLTIPDSVTIIGDYSFYNCTGLNGNLIIGSNVTTIGYQAFRYSSGITGTLELPDSVTTIDAFAFYACRKLTGSLTIPDSVTIINSSAFYDCESLNGDLVIGSNVTTIGNSCFYDCEKLASITIKAQTPPTLGGTSCFDRTNNCPIYVPSASVDAYKTATNWSEYASRIQAIVEGQQVDASGVITSQTESKYTGVVYQIDTSTGKASIKANSSVSATEIVVFDQVIYDGKQYVVDTITASAFANNTTLTKITIPSAITTIEPKAFAGCTSLANIVFENTANWHCSITADSTYGTALSVTNSATNIANLTTNYCDLYIKSGTFTSAITLKIEAELPTVDDYNFYVQFTSGMTWAELIAHDTLKYGVNSVNNLIGTIVEGRWGPVYCDANFTTTTSIPAPIPDVTQVVSSSVIDATKTYLFASDMMRGPLGLWERT